MAAACALGAAAVLAGSAAGGDAGGPGPGGKWYSAELVTELKQRGWEPPYFRGSVRTHKDGYHLELARKALRRSARTLEIGGFRYHTSRALIEAGREIFTSYHFGTHRFWDFRRAIDWSTGVTDPAEYEARYGVKRDGEGLFVGIVGVEGEDGFLGYGHSCALCHAGVDAQGRIVYGQANHAYDIGRYYDALRPNILDVNLVYLGDAPLKLLRFQGPGRTDPTMDSNWAPVKIPHLFAVESFQHGLRSNGDIPNLWVQCYRNLNSAYAVESEIMEALMAFVLSIEAPENEARAGDLEKRGEEIFREQGCQDCHGGDHHTDGRVIDWKMIRTDPGRIRNGYPKGYRVPSLDRLDLERLYLHDGALTSLEQLFDPARLERSYQAPGIPQGRPGRGGGVPGHEFGLRLEPADRKALVAYLKTL